MRLLILLLSFIAAVAGAEPLPASHAVVLMYHRFGDDRFPSTNVTLEAFGSQLDLLAARGFHVWPLARIVDHFAAGRPVPDKVVAITVDDAYRSVYENGWPLMRERGWPMTVFVSTDAVDQGLSDYLSWDQMREMRAAGVDFANHSASHEHLIEKRPGETDGRWLGRVRADLERAERRLQEELGPDANGARLMAYPYGEYSLPLAALAGELGFTAFGQHSGAIGPGMNRQSLPRFPIAEAYSDLPEFATKVASLPLPVEQLEPRDPIVGADNPPRLTLTLAREGLGVGCYASGQGGMTPEWTGPRRVSVQAAAPYPPGRARYNCTAPAGEGRWFWFSQPWFVPPVETDPGG